MHGAPVQQGRERRRAAGDGGQREASGDRLGVHRQVRRQAVVLAGAAQRQPETGDHLVEDHQRAVGMGCLQHAFQVAGARLAAAGVGQQRLGDHAGDPCAVLREQRP